MSALEEERDFLLASLDDLEREFAAGDVDEADYRALWADYTTRAAAVIRAIQGERSASATPPPLPSRWRSVVVAGGLVGVAVLAGILVAQSSGRRGGGSVTGLDVTAASARLDDCIALERGGDPDAGLDCYTSILDELPANVQALTFRGWLQVRSFDLDAGLADLDAAIQLSPEATAARVFRASGRMRSGDPRGAVADLAAFLASDPPEEERSLADGLAAAIVQGALDECIGGDVDGSLQPVDVVQCYQDVLAVEPGEPTASVYLGWLLARSGVADEQARRLLDDGLRSAPELSAGYVFRAALLAHLGETESALADLDRFDGLDAPEDQVAAAAQVRGMVEAGLDPLG